MKRRATGILLALCCCFGVRAAVPEPLGQFGGWGAFRAADPARCYAIAQPGRSGRRGAAFLTVSSWPKRRLFRQVHVRLRGVAEGEAVLRVGESRFRLVTAGAEAWPASAADGKRIARALRQAEVLRVTARIRGRRITDSYALAGAASAIDAADLACLRG